MGEWSVKDILAHVTTWEEEALKYLPLIITGGRPPRYIQYGGIDAFNAQKAEQKRDMALSEVLRQLEETHRRLLDYLNSVPEALQAAFTYAFTVLGTRLIHAECERENTTSARVMQKCGMEYEGTIYDDDGLGNWEHRDRYVITAQTENPL